MIAVVDYGAGNLRSITRALEANGASVEVTADPNRIQQADRAVLPGVGNAKAAMQRLQDLGLAEAISKVASEGKPVLGICLGMQLLFGPQEEGPTTGLGILDGAAKGLSRTVKIPHMGWNMVTFTQHRLLADVQPGFYYFVHSFAVHPNNVGDIAGITEYGTSFPSVVIHNHIWGTQFHPEKSGQHGLDLLKLWLEWSP